MSDAEGSGQRREQVLAGQAGIPEDYDYPFELYWELETFEAQQAFVTAVSEILGPGSIDDIT